MERHIMYEREKRTPLELASDPKEFANTYAELCGVIPIDDLVDLYRKAFPEPPMDYETMRKAAAGREASWNGVCETWRHEDVEALLDVRVSRPDRPRRDDMRFYIAHHTSRVVLRASTMIDVNSNSAYEDAEFLMIYTYPPGPRDYDPFRDEPDPNVLLAMEKVYRELPLWGLNGWNQEEVRAQMLEKTRNEKSLP